MPIKGLPSGWSLVRLGDLVAAAQNGCSARRSDSGVPTAVLRLADVSADAGVASQGLRLVPLDADQRRKYGLMPGDLLVFRVNGSRAIAGTLLEYKGPSGLAYCDHFIRLRLRDGVLLPKFCEYAFRSPYVRKQVDRRIVSTAGQNTISQRSIAAIELPIPPLAEQRRILGKLDDLLARCRRARAALRATRPLLAQLRGSVLSAAFRGDLTERARASLRDPRAEMAREEGGLPQLPEGWRWAKVEDLCDVIDPHPSHRTPPEVTSGVPYIGMGDVREGGRLDREGARRVSPDVLLAHRARYSLTEGDFIFGKIGTLGSPVKLAPPYDYCVSANVALIKPRAAEVDPEWPFLFLQAPFVAARLAGQRRATSQSAFGIKRVRELPVPVAPPPEQRRILARVRSLFRSIDSIAAMSDALEGSITALEASALERAFCGELATQS